MSLLQEYKTCPKCHRKYSWNPDIGQLNCPYCLKAGKVLGGILGGILGNSDFPQDNHMPDEVSIPTENPNLSKSGVPSKKQIRIDK